MNAENMRDLAKVRYERAEELLKDAESLLQNDSWMSANNRAFYAAEKAVKAALAVKGKDAETHNGVLKTFNMELVRDPGNSFGHEDLILFQSMERIRAASDYDDFYVTSRAECEEQVGNARTLIERVSAYLQAEGILLL